MYFIFGSSVRSNDALEHVAVWWFEPNSVSKSKKYLAYNIHQSS